MQNRKLHPLFHTTTWSKSGANAVTVPAHRNSLLDCLTKRMCFSMRWGFWVGFCKLRGRGCGGGRVIRRVEWGGEAFDIKHEVTGVRVGEADWRCERWRTVDSQTRSSTLRPRYPSQNQPPPKKDDRIQIRTSSLQKRNQKRGDRFIDDGSWSSGRRAAALGGLIHFLAGPQRLPRVPWVGDVGMGCMLCAFWWCCNRSEGWGTDDGWVGRECRGGPVLGLVCWGDVLIECFWGREDVVRWARRRLVRYASRMGWDRRRRACLEGRWSSVEELGGD